MNLSELVTEVYAFTTRPDLVEKTKSAVKAATLKMHHVDFFDRDLHENGINLGASLNIQNFEYKALFPLWRALKYIRYLDITTTPATPGDFFDVIAPEQVLDSYKVTKTNVCYLAGANLQINGLAAFQYILLGHYEHPDITDAGYNSWIAQEHPYAIIYEAARNVCKFIGKDQEYTRLENSVAEEIQLLKATAVQTRGY